MGRVKAFSVAEALVTLAVVALILTVLFLFYSRLQKRLGSTPKELRVERECALFLRDLRQELSRRSPTVLPETESDAWIFSGYTLSEGIFKPILLEVRNLEVSGEKEVLIRSLDYATREVLREKHFPKMSMELSLSQKTNQGVPGAVSIQGELRHASGMVLKELFLAY